MLGLSEERTSAWRAILWKGEGLSSRFGKFGALSLAGEGGSLSLCLFSGTGRAILSSSSLILSLILSGDFSFLRWLDLLRGFYVSLGLFLPCMANFAENKIKV